MFRCLHPLGDVGAAVAVIVKQAVERIGRIRETALRHLRVLLAAGQGGEAGGSVREWILAAKELDTYVPSQVNQAIPSCVEEHFK